MKTLRNVLLPLGAVATAVLVTSCADFPSSRAMGFFVTSAGPGKGGDLGGLAGADAHCQSLATAAGLGRRPWRAYLSADATPTTPAVNARDRIGSGPWYNAQGVLVASDLAQLHGENNITKATALTEKGAVVNGRGDTPNTHDMLTGSTPEGRAIGGAQDLTCGNWSRNDDNNVKAMTGHHDRTGTSPPPTDKSWNSSHPSAGCAAETLPKTGGAGLFYCFAAN
jgi:hypothetical protein